MMDLDYFLEKLFYFLVFILFVQHRCLLHIHHKKSPIYIQKTKKRKYLEFFNKAGELYSNAEKGQSQTDCVKFSNTQCIPIDQIEIPLYNGQECVLGRGAHGVVVKGKFQNKYVALKRFEVNIDNLDEFNIMKKLHHRNIVNIIGIVKEPKIMLVMDYIEFGSLKEFLLKYDVSRLEELQLLKYAQDIASGMEYLETKKIIHRDLATRNILIDSKDQLKISDFGLAKCLQPGNYIYSIGTARPLPFRWYSPEAIKPGPVFSHKSDVWSFGVTLWEMFNLGLDPNYPLKNPNSVSELLEFFKDGKRLLKPDKNIPNTETIWPIIQSCWIFEPEARPNFSILKKNLTNLKIIYEMF